MNRSDRLTRRSACRLVGIAALAPVLAGCGGPGDEDETDEEAVDEAWADVDEIVLEGHEDGWVGVEPEPILDETNPTLVLEEGNEYEITMENGDGEDHNLSVYEENGDNGSRRDDVAETEILNEEGETASISFEAEPDLDEYMCDLHPDNMTGEIDVHEGVGGDDEDEEE